jgi:hypothetical protein
VFCNSLRGPLRHLRAKSLPSRAQVARSLCDSTLDTSAALQAGDERSVSVTVQTPHGLVISGYIRVVVVDANEAAAAVGTGTGLEYTTHPDVLDDVARAASERLVQGSAQPLPLQPFVPDPFHRWQKPSSSFSACLVTPLRLESSLQSTARSVWEDTARHDQPSAACFCSCAIAPTPVAVNRC